MDTDRPNTPRSSFPDLSLSEISVTRGHDLPRWDVQGAVYHITFRLADSLPAAALAELQAMKDEGESLSDKMEAYLHAGCGDGLLLPADVQATIEKTLRYEDGTRYALHAYAIMPNHIHVIVGGFRSEGEMLAVVSQWKHVTARQVNRLTGHRGAVWQRDAYTHIIRSERAYRHLLSYVYQNPVMAGLSADCIRWRRS